MKRKRYSHLVKWRVSDPAHLSRALKRTKDAKVYQRILALRLIAAGWSVSSAARFIHRSRQTVYLWLERYGRRHRIADLQAAPRSGRPRQASVLTEARIVRELHRSPLALGYAALTWTVPLLARHLQQRYQCPISPWTLRRRMKQIGLEWKRPRYVYVEKDPYRAQKKWAILRRLHLRPPGTVLLAEDETILRLFPPLRSAWARRGEQAQVPITGRNARRVLQGAVNLDTAHRVLMRHANRQHANFGAFLRLLRRRYRQRSIWLLLDKDPSHTARANRRLARQLNIRLIWLPKQCPELNPMDQLWKEVKREMAANRQFKTIDEGADHAENWIQSLSRWQVFQKTGLFSERYWLRVR